MAVLSKIRQRSLLLILVIGFCLLAFIIGDIINSGGFGVTRNVGSVNGEDIPVQEFLQKVNDLQARQQGISPTQAANMIWNQEVDNILFEDRYEKAGLRVGRDHVLNVYGQDPNVAQQFSNALGKFDKAKFNEFLVNMKTTNPAQWQMIERNKPMVENAAKKQLYLSMLRAGVFATDVDAKARYAQESDKVSFDYVMVPYSTINDDQVKVSDEELIEYMKKNEKKYKADASRDIEFVLIDNKPSAADEAEIKENITALLSPKVEYNEATQSNDTIPGFREVTDVEEFVNRHSDIKYDTTYVTKQQLPVEFAEQLYNLPQGEVFGPYIDNGYYKLTRKMDKKAGASAKASHILIAYKGAMRAAPTITRTKEEAKAKADELLIQAKANPNGFAALATANTDDPGSKNTGGEYDNIMPGQMVKPFDDFVFNSPVGSIGVVETDFGYHVIKVSGKNEAVQLATIAQKIQASESTTDAIFTKASKMEMEAETKPFDQLAKELNLTVTPANGIASYDESIPGIGSQRAIVKWAFDKNTEVGAVKKFDVPQGHVIARLKSINEKGVLPLEQAKVSVLPILRNEKKAELIRKKMAGSSLEAVAQATGSSVAKAENVTLASPMITNVGSEPKVVGKAFGLGAGKTSGHIDGNLGVFMIRTTAATKAPALPNYNTYTTRMKMEGRGSVSSRVSMTLRDNAEIEDNRSVIN